MAALYEAIPDVEVLLAMEAEELGGVLIQSVPSILQNDMFNRNDFFNQLYDTRQPHQYPGHRREEVWLALEEALGWLEAQGLIVWADQYNGKNGYRKLSRRGRKPVQPTAFKAYRQGSLLPKGMLHATIAERVWLLFVRGDLDTAVFQAFKEVEVAVRSACGYPDTEIGVPLMRKAFHPETGPLTKEALPNAEREALSSLFAGAIGSYKNPQSHRTVALHDPGEAAEMIMMASHLLRIVDARRSS